ncbi:MAG: glycosyl transferase family 1 [Desulfobulbaceae bacterium S5133MH15]|nr:MAG: glycosyl transferase family 1 [Desulfobulbaceae bacterium S5133MH15]
MKVLLSSRYSRVGASSRLRSYQYLPYLEEHGIDVTVFPLLGDDYLACLYSNNRKDLRSVAFSCLRRCCNLLKSRSFDLVWIEKEAFPWLPAWAEIALSRFGIPYIVDYDDAIFHRYDQNLRKVVRTFLGNKIAMIMRHADAVIVGNNYLAEYAVCAGAQRVEFIPTVIDLNRYSIKERTKAVELRVGWIGSPQTAKYLNLVKPAIRRLYNEGNVSFSLVGSGQIDTDGVPMSILPWSEETEVDHIQDFDIGIMPLPDSPWERGKCGYKLIQYMACGKPVVASSVGANRKIVEHGVNGFLAGPTEEWLQALTVLRDNPDLREKMGTAGRKKVEEKYCIQVTARRLLSIIQSVGKNYS